MTRKMSCTEIWFFLEYFYIRPETRYRVSWCTDDNKGGIFVSLTSVVFCHIIETSFRGNIVWCSNGEGVPMRPILRHFHKVFKLAACPPCDVSSSTSFYTSLEKCLVSCQLVPNQFFFHLTVTIRGSWRPTKAMTTMWAQQGWPLPPYMAWWKRQGLVSKLVYLAFSASYLLLLLFFIYNWLHCEQFMHHV